MGGVDFEDNTAEKRGGGMNTFLFSGEEMVLENSFFCGNTCTGSEGGGGL